MVPAINQSKGLPLNGRPEDRSSASANQGGPPSVLATTILDQGDLDRPEWPGRELNVP